MPFNLRFAIFIVACVLAFTVMRILVVLALWPDFFLFFVNLLRFQTTSNMVIGVFIVILIFITMSLTVIVSSQKNKINLLIQEVSMLKQEIKDKSND